MAKLDKQNRLTIPKQLLTASSTDFNSEVRLYMRGKEIYFDNPSNANLRKHCLGIIKVESNGRFHLPKLVRVLFNCKTGDNFNFYLLENKITFKKFFFIPEIR